MKRGQFPELHEKLHGYAPDIVRMGKHDGPANGLVKNGCCQAAGKTHFGIRPLADHPDFLHNIATLTPP